MTGIALGTGKPERKQNRKKEIPALKDFSGTSLSKMVATSYVWLFGLN